MYAVPAAHGPISAATCGMTPLATTSSRKRSPEAREQRADGLLDARARAVEQPDERHPLAQRQRAQARDLHLAGRAHRPGHDGEVVGRDGDEPPVDPAVARDDAVGRRLPGPPARGRRGGCPAWMPSSVNVPSSTSSADALARRELAGRVLTVDLLLAPAQARGGAAGLRGPRTADAGSNRSCEQRRDRAGDELGVPGRRGRDLGADDRADAGRDGEELAERRRRQPARRGELRREAPAGRGRRGRGGRRARGPRAAPGSSTRCTPLRSSATRSGPSRSRTPCMITRAGSTPAPKPVSHRPQAPARPMPPR